MYISDALEVETCSCPVPCYSIQYVAKTSRSDLNKYNIQKLVFPDITRYKYTHKRFLAAREARERVDKNLRNKNNNLISQFQRSTSQLSSIIRNKSSILHLRKLWKSSLNLTSMLKRDRETLNETLVMLWYRSALHVVNAHSTVEAIEYTKELLEAQHITHETIDRLKYCIYGQDNVNLQEEMMEITKRYLQAPSPPSPDTGGMPYEPTESNMTGDIPPPPPPEQTFENITNEISNASLSAIYNWMAEKTSGAYGKQTQRKKRDVDQTSSNTGRANDTVSNKSKTRELNDSCRNNVEVAASALRSIAGNVTNLQMVMKANVPRLVSKYDRDIEELFSGTKKDPESYREHVACRAALVDIQGFAFVGIRSSSRHNGT